LCAAQSAPVGATPPTHVHCFCAHWRSLVALAARDSYWCSLHTVCDAHVPGVVGVGATTTYSSASHLFTSLHVLYGSGTFAQMKPGLKSGVLYEWLFEGVLQRADLPLARAVYVHSPSQWCLIGPNPLGM